MINYETNGFLFVVQTLFNDHAKSRRPQIRHLLPFKVFSVTIRWLLRLAVINFHGIPASQPEFRYQAMVLFAIVS